MTSRRIEHRCLGQKPSALPLSYEVLEYEGRVELPHARLQLATQTAMFFVHGGFERIRTPGVPSKNRMLYLAELQSLMVLEGIEPSTFSASGRRAPSTLQDLIYSTRIELVLRGLQPPLLPLQHE